MYEAKEEAKAHMTKAIMFVVVNCRNYDSTEP